MHYQVLGEGLEGASSKARLCLIKFVRAFGVERTVPMSIADMAQEIGVRPAWLREPVRELVSLGVLRSEDHVRGRGRPIKSYSVEYWLARRLVSSRSRLPRHHYQIERLLDFQNEPFLVPYSGISQWNPPLSAKKTMRLSDKMRVLVSVILYHADASGRANTLNHKVLSKFTGIPRKHLGYWMDRCFSLGLIYPLWVHTEGGITFFREAAFCRINFFSPCFLEACNLVRTVFCSVVKKCFSQVFHAGYYPYLGRIYLSHNELIDDEERSDLITVLNNAEIDKNDLDWVGYQVDSTQPDLLGHAIRQYVSMWLSKNNESFLGDVEEIPEWLVFQVSNDQVGMDQKEREVRNFNAVVCKLVLKMVSFVSRTLKQEIEGFDLSVSLVKVVHKGKNKSESRSIRVFFYDCESSHNKQEKSVVEDYPFCPELLIDKVEQKLRVQY